MKKTIDAILGSPEEKERLEVALFDTVLNTQWGTVDVEAGSCMLELYPKASDKPIRVDLAEAIHVLTLAKKRLEETYPDVVPPKEA